MAGVPLLVSLSGDIYHDDGDDDYDGDGDDDDDDDDGDDDDDFGL